jgi:lipopolysaccharide export system protein LptA
MTLSIQRLRWVLLAAAVLLVVVVTAYIGYSRYRAVRAYKRILARSGATFAHDTNGFTYSQSVQGKTIFTLHAKKATQLGDGKWALHDGELTLYGRGDGEEDHVYSSEIEYDQNEGVARAKGEVQMDLHAPGSLGGAAKQVIHVRTSGLVYLHSLGVAATEQPVEFRYGNMQCTALGAEFNTSQSTLHLLANVVMDGATHGQPVHITAVKADMDRTANVASLTDPVMTSQGRSAKSQSAVANLRKDGSIQTLLGSGGVVFASGTQQVTAERLDAVFDAQSKPQTARLSGNVVLVDNSALRPMQGSAKRVDAVFDTQGAVTSATASGAAKLSVLDKKAEAKGLRRAMEGETIVATFVPGKRKGKNVLREIHATGAAHALGDSISGTGAKAQRKILQVAADDLRMTFVADAADKPQPLRLLGAVHTMLQQDAPLGEQETSQGDTLDASFASSDGLTLLSALQTGAVRIRDQAATKPGATQPSTATSGTAERAEYDAATERLTLTGNAHLEGDNVSLSAPTVWMDRLTQDATATGGVSATMWNAQQPNAAVTHVLAATAHQQHATKLTEFRGSDAAPAKMWQDASQVQAAVLLFDGVRRTLSARPAAKGALVHAVFAGRPKEPVKSAASVARVASAKMDYNDVQREATFSGRVTIDGSMGEVRGENAVVFLQPAKDATGAPQQKPAPTSALVGTSGSLERVVVSGEVQLDEPGRHGSGEQLVYTAATGEYVLTGSSGKLPVIVDAQQGSVTGATLLFRSGTSAADSTIVVSGDAATKVRVRTETEVRQQ